MSYFPENAYGRSKSTTVQKEIAKWQSARKVLGNCESFGCQNIAIDLTINTLHSQNVTFSKLLFLN